MLTDVGDFALSRLLQIEIWQKSEAEKKSSETTIINIKNGLGTPISWYLKKKKTLEQKQEIKFIHLRRFF